MKALVHAEDELPATEGVGEEGLHVLRRNGLLALRRRTAAAAVTSPLPGNVELRGEIQLVAGDGRVSQFAPRPRDLSFELLAILRRAAAAGPVDLLVRTRPVVRSVPPFPCLPGGLEMPRQPHNHLDDERPHNHLDDEDDEDDDEDD